MLRRARATLAHGHATRNMLSYISKSFIAGQRSTMATSDDAKPPIDLLRGHPNASLLPVDLMRRAVQRLSADVSRAELALIYGKDEGDAKLRAELAKWLTDFYKVDSIPADRVCITGGASQSLGCILMTFTEPVYTRNIWIVAPAYMLAFRIFQDAGFVDKMRAVPEDEEGIDIEYLRKEIQRSEDQAKAAGNNHPVYKQAQAWSKIYKHVIYAVPTFSNPSSKTMSLKRRQALVRLAREFDALVVTDDVYDFLQWPSEKGQKALAVSTMPRVVDVDRTLDGGARGFGNAVSNGSFSKIAGPGLRTGWVEGTVDFAYGCSQTGTSRSGGAPSQYTASAIAEVLETGELQSHVTKILLPAYAERYHSMRKAIEEHIVPLGVELPQTQREAMGGYFIWLNLPTPLEAAKVTAAAQAEENLVVAAGDIFQVPGDKSALFPRSLRLCFAWEETTRLEEGIKRLAKVIRKSMGHAE